MKATAMPDFRNSFPYFGLITHRNPIQFKVGVIIKSCLVWIVFAARIIIPSEVIENYKLSYYFSKTVLIIVFFGAATTLLESFRTIHKYKLLIRKLNDIDFYLNSIPQKKHCFMGPKLLIIYGIVSISAAIAFPFIVYVGDFQGNFYFYFYPICLMKLRTFQITIWLDEFAVRIILFNKKMETAWHLRAFIHIKKIYLAFLDFNTLFHQCFECSLMSITICYSLDFINTLYWCILPLLGLLEYGFLVLCAPTGVTLAFQVFILSRICQLINDEVSFFWEKNVDCNSLFTEREISKNSIEEVSIGEIFIELLHMQPSTSFEQQSTRGLIQWIRFDQHAVSYESMVFTNVLDSNFV